MMEVLNHSSKVSLVWSFLSTSHSISFTFTCPLTTSGCASDFVAFALYRLVCVYSSLLTLWSGKTMNMYVPINLLLIGYNLDN